MGQVMRPEPKNAARYVTTQARGDELVLTLGDLWRASTLGVLEPELAASIPLTDTLSYPVYRLFMSGLCVVLAIGLYLLISKTRLGMKIRAGAFNHEMTEALGVNIKRIHAVVFALGVGLASIAGMLATPSWLVRIW